jgi:TonB-linked SusC/RagA family outer membrane protein
MKAHSSPQPLSPSGWLSALAIAAALLLLPGAALAQTGTVSGTVVDAQTGDPVSGAQVSIEGTRRGTLSGEDGSYTVTDVRPGTYTVAVQRIGYATARQEGVRVQQGAVASVDFRLREHALRLDEVVATGVADPIEGRRMPFSVGRLSGDNLGVPNPQSGFAQIQGRIPGVSIVRPSGQPGTGLSMLLRTPTSVVRNNSPMYVVDGVVLKSTAGGTTVDIESLDIESIEVVKGAAAAALYGSRAAAGVIAITTHRGSHIPQDRTQFTVRSELGVSSLARQVPLAQYHFYEVGDDGRYIHRTDGMPTDDRGARAVADDRMMTRPYPEHFNNVAEFFQPGRFMTNSASLAHNTGATNFLLSVNNVREEGTIVTNDGYERTNFRANIDHRPLDNVTLSTSIYHSRSWRDDLTGPGGATQDGSPFWHLMMFEPDIDLGARDEDGHFIQQPDPTLARENPIWRQTTRDFKEHRGRTLLNATARFVPFDWLSFDGTFSYDNSDIFRDRYTPRGIPFVSIGDDEDTADGSLSQQEVDTDVINAAASARLLWTFGDLTARTTLRGLMERESYIRTTAIGRDFWVEGVRSLDVARDMESSSFWQEIRANGWFVQTGLDYGGRYIADLLVRRDGSSLFGPEARWQTYYRASAAYRMAEEAWWPFAGFITEFKPRYSIGTAGGRPNFSDQYETWNISSEGVVTKGTLGNRFLEPEHTTEQEAGLDIIFRDRVQLELTYARQVTDGQLVQIPQPAATGFSLQWQNAGEITGNTLEATLEALVLQTPNLSWTSTLVGDRSRSHITRWDRPCYIGSGTLFSWRCEGANLTEMHGFRHLQGFDELPEHHSGSQAAFDVNDDGYLVPVGAGGSWRDGRWGEQVEIDGESYAWGMPILLRDEAGSPDRVLIGEGNPDVTLGWINQLRWRDLSFSTHLHAQLGGDIYNQTKQRLYQHYRHGDLDQAHKPEDERKPIDYYQILYNTNNATQHFVEDGTFLKVRELAVNYTLGEAMLGRLGVARVGADRVRVGLVGRNLFTFTGYSGFDPEVGTLFNRRDYMNWPNVRTVTANVEIRF